MTGVSPSMSEDDDWAEFQEFQRFRAMRRGPLQAKPERLVADLWQEWFDQLVPSSAFAMAARSHRRFLDLPFTFQGEQVTVAAQTPSSCTPALLQAWRKKLGTLTAQGKGTPYSPATLDQIRMCLQTAFSYHVKVGALARNPYQGIERERGRDRRRQGYYTPDEVSRLAAAMPSIHGFLFRHLFLSCCRRDSLRLLKKHQIAWETAEVVVLLKGGRKERVPIPLVMLEELRHLVALAPGEYVYPNPRDPQGGPIPKSSLQKRVKEAGKTTGIQTPEGHMLHLARHGGAIDMLDHGADITDVKAQLCHRNIATTARYLEMRERMRGRLREIAERRKVPTPK